MPPATHADAQSAIKVLDEEVTGLLKQYVECLDKIKIREGIRHVMSISQAGNKFFQVVAASLGCEMNG